MHKILIVSQTKSYLLNAIEEQLKGLEEYQVVKTQADIDEISVIKEPQDAILLYVDSNDVDDIMGIIPTHMMQKKFVRPIDVKNVVNEVDEYVQHHGKHTKKKILVVDDSGAMLRNVKGWLEDRYQVILANSGAMAIKYLALNRPDLVLLDYEMPVVNGKQVLEMIRTETEFSDIPVIFLTSKNDRESITQVMSLKPEGYLLKTMKPEDIVKTVDDFFEKRKKI